jgi:hypothetical protein
MVVLLTISAMPGLGRQIYEAEQFVTVGAPLESQEVQVVLAKTAIEIIQAILVLLTQVLKVQI